MDVEMDVVVMVFPFFCCVRLFYSPEGGDAFIQVLSFLAVPFCSLSQDVITRHFPQYVPRFLQADSGKRGIQESQTEKRTKTESPS